MKKIFAQTIGAIAVAALSTVSTFAQTTGFNQTAAGSYDYNDPANWVGGTINGIWDSSLTLAGAQTSTFTATPTTPTGLTFNYGGNFAVTLQSTNTTAQTFTLGGDIGLNTGGGTAANVTIGNAANPLTVDLGGDNRTITVAASRTLTIVNAISSSSGSYGITNAGAGTLVLNGTNSTYSGGTTLNAGTLQIGSGSALGTGAVAVNGGTFKWNYISGNGNFSNNVVVNGATTIDVGAGNFNFYGNLSGSGTITRGTAANLTWYLNGDDSGYAGTFTIPNNGNAVVRFTSTNSGSAGASWVFNNATAGRDTLEFNGAGTISFGSLTGSGVLQSGNNNGAKTISAGALGLTDAFSGIIANGSSTVALTKVGSGTMTLSGANTYTGDTTISAGTLAIGGAGKLGGGNYAGALINNGSFNYGSSAAQTLSGPINGNGNLTMSGSSTLALSGACSFTGNLTVSAGTLTLASPQSFSPNTVGVSDGATLSEAFSPSVQMTATSLTLGFTTGATNAFVANSTSLARVTAGTLTLNGVNTLNIIGGNLAAGSSYPLIAYTTLAGAGSYVLGTLPPGVAGNLSTTAGSPNVVYFNVTGVTNTVWTGAVNGTWDINTTANWTNAGTLGNKYVDGSPVQFDDTGLNTTTISNSTATTLSPISVLVTNNSQNYAFKANTIIAGTASLTKTGTANLTNSTANTYTGPTAINQGQLVVGVASVANTSGALGNNSAVSLANDSTAVLNLNNFATQVGSLSGGGASGGNVTLGSATLTVGGDNSSTTYGGVVSGTGGLSKIGTGALTLSGAHAFTGGWSVNAGTLNYNGSLASGGALTVNGSGANSIVNIGSGANLTFNNVNLLIGNNAAGAGALFQSGGNIYRVNQLQLGSVTGGSYGYYNLSGGTIGMLEFDLGSFNGAAVGVCDISGGVINVTNWFVPSRGTSATGILNMTGGAFNYYGPAGQFLGNWNGGAGSVTVLNIANASLIAPNANVNLMQNGQVGKLGEINLLSGGLLQANGIAPGSATGTSMLNFNGGTLKAVTANGNFLTANNSSVNVYSGGGTIDNNGVAITIPKALSAPAGNGLNGSVTIDNGGSGYIGAPAVTFSGDGTGATAYATISGGAVTGVVITSPGVNYSSTPTVVFTGGGGSGAAATAPTPTANTSGGLTFQGSGTTTLTGVNTYAGGTKVLGGTLVINTTTSGAQGGGDLVVSNAALNLTASGGTALAAGNLTLQGTNVLTFAPSPLAADSSTTCINLSGALSNTGTNRITVSGIGLTVGVYHLITAASGTVSTNNFILAGLPLGAQGVLTNSTSTTLDFMITSIGQVLSWFGNPSSTPAPWDIGVTADWTPDHGSSLTTYNQYFANTMGDLVFFGQDGANTTDTNYVNLVANVVPASVKFNWVYPYVLTGSGSIGGITSLVVTDAPSVFLGTSNSYTGGTFVYGGSLTITNNNALGASSGGVTLGGGTLQLNGVTSARNLAVTGNSSLGVAANTATALSGNINGTANLVKSGAGSLTLSGSITNTGSLEFLAGTNTITSTSPVTIGGELWAGVGSDTNNFGVLNIQPGANVTANSWIVAGRGGYGILNMNGGTLTKGGDNNSHISIGGTSTNQTGILNLNSGLIQDTTGDCWLGEAATAIVNQNGGTLANTGGSVYMGRLTTSDSTYNLNGGLLQTRSIIGNFVAVSNAVFNFNGGTLQAGADSSAFVQGLTAAHVSINGAIIDTTNFNITIPQALADDPANGPGKLVKLGTGLLTLSGSNTINGPITVSQGTLLLTPADQGTNVVTVANGAAYGVQLTGGPGSVTNAAITLNSGSTTLSFALGANGNPGQPLIVCGPLTNNGTLNVAVGVNSTLLTVGSVIPLVKYSGSIAGAGSLNPTIVTRGSSMTLSNEASGHTLYAVVNAVFGGIVWTGTNSAPGLTNLWDLNSTTNWLIAGGPTSYQETLLPPGDAVVFNDLGSGTVLLSNTVSPAGVTISNSAVNYTFQGTGQINSAAGLTKLGAGTATLNLSGTYSGSTVISNGTISLGTNQSFANLTGNGTISTASGSPTLTVNGSANTTFSGTLQGGLGLTKTDNGSLTLSGSSTSFAGATLVNAGTLNVSGTVGQTGSSAITTVGGVSSNATLAISGAMNQKNFFVGNANGAVGAVYQTAGTVTATNGGGDNLCVGNIFGGFGYYNLSGGTVLANGLAVGGENNNGSGFTGTGGNGVLDITGGFLNDIGWLVAARGAAAETGVINVFDGALAYAGGGIVNCWGSPQTGIVNILGGTVTNSIDVGFNLNQRGNTNNIGILNLNGGLTQANGIGGAAAQVNFGGGTLRASKATTTYINGIGSANVYSGGGTIDNNGFNITIPQALLAPTDSGVSISSFTPGGSGYIAPPIVIVTNSAGSGATAIAQINPTTGVITNVIITCPGVGYTGTPGLSYSGGGGTGTPTVVLTTAANVSGGMTFQGAGTTILSGTNTYTGNTVVGNGTLQVNGSISTGATTVTGGTLAGTGTIGGALTNKATLFPGIAGVGTLTVNGNITLNPGSTNTFNVNGSTSAHNTVAAGGAVNYGGQLNIVPSGTFSNGQTFTLFSGPGVSSASNFATIAGSPGAGLVFTFTNGVLGVATMPVGPGVPEYLTNSYNASTHTLSLAWPAGENWRLQMQTNSLSKGLGTNWQYITDGTISSTNITVDPTLPTVFYRLRYP